MSGKRIQQLLAALLLAGLLIANVIATHDVLTEPHPGHNDFLTVWEAGRSFWRDGLDPYGEQATINIQTRIYGRPATEDEFPNYYAYPLYTLLLMVPLVFSGFAWASAIWMVASEVFLIAALILLLNLFRWRPRPWLLALLLLWVLLNYYAARGLILGQVSHFIYVTQVLVLWALARRLDVLAGVVLAVTTMKPQMGFLLVPFLILWAIRVRRWHFVAAAASVWLALMVLSFALQPDWMQGWLAQLRDYPSYTDIGAPTEILMQDTLGLGALGVWAANLALWAVLGWAWFTVLVQGHGERFDWVVMLTLTVTHLSALRTATPHFVIFTIPLVFYFKQLDRRAAWRAWIVVILVMTLIVPWVHFVLTVSADSAEHASLYLPPPLIMLAVLWITRRLWWRHPVIVGDNV